MSSPFSVDRYKDAGVDIEAGNQAAARYKTLAEKTHRSGMLGGIGGFAGGFALDVSKYPEPILVSGTDGVGTKLKVAFAAGIHHTIGIDCVAMCVNDILTSGAEPLFFLDYLAVGSLSVEVAAAIVEGIAEGCTQAGAALVGGETAEMPGMYQVGEYDVAGFSVGVVNRSEMIDGQQIAPGHVVLGIASSGLHSNGFSLVRKLISEAGLTWEDQVDGWRGNVAEELLRPTKIYVKPIRALLAANVPVHGMAHITGGGLMENIPRILPAGTSVQLDVAKWSIPAVFDWLMSHGQMSFAEAARVWNLGVGYVVIVPEEAAVTALALLADQGETAWRIGQVISGEGEVRLI
jgi:phosphoribosylformylglycinamidine cyclo-ligase